MPVINQGVLDGVRRIGAKVRDLTIDGTLPGAPIGLRIRGATTSGAPTSGTWKAGDHIEDRNGNIWICTAAGSPGTWINAAQKYALVAAQSGGFTAAGYVAAMMNPVTATTTSVGTHWTSGYLFGQWLFAIPGVTVNGYVSLYPWAGGALSGTYIGLFNSAGTQIGLTADMSSVGSNGRGVRVAVPGFTKTPADGKIFMVYTNGTSASGAGPAPLNNQVTIDGYPSVILPPAGLALGSSYQTATTMPSSLTFGTYGVPTSPSAWNYASTTLFNACLD